MWPASDSIYRLTIVLTALAVTALGANQEARVVQTLQGAVRGYREADEDVFSFYGIPYATAPTGKDRFKATLPGPVWLTTLNAVNNNTICPQYSGKVTENGKPGDYGSIGNVLNYAQMQENCLVANVYIPKTNSSNIPVVVYVHGGAFQIGYGNTFLPKKLVATENVIAVTFNYRLGIHGFLCLGTKDVPGNAGMKDQVALLRWVKSNIASFGGNPEDVTIAGYSAGSASVELLMLSPVTKGLFNKVITEGSSSLSAYAVQMRPLENAKEFARRYISNVDDICALEEFYKTASFQDLTSDSFYFRTDSTFAFAPCVESIVGADSFLNESPYKILKTGNYRKVPVLYGFTDMEGSYRLPLFDFWKDAMSTNLTDFLPPDRQYQNEADIRAVADKVKKFYFGDKNVNQETILGYVDYFSDVSIVYPMAKAVDFYAASGHDGIYLYYYNFVDENTPVVPYTNVRGAAHVAQTEAVLDSANENNISEDYKKMKVTMRQLWGNFIKYGKPVPAGSALPQWPPTSTSGIPYMELGRTVRLRNEQLLRERMGLWDSVYINHYREPTPPTPFC